MSQLVLTRLGVAYPDAERPALTDVSLQLSAGETLAVVGESGSGKSTLALAVAGLLPPGAVQTGVIAWQGGKQPRRGIDVGIIFQDPVASLDPVMEVGRQIAEVARVAAGMSRTAAVEEAGRLLRLAGFDDPRTVLPAFPHHLSGGQAQRVAIACALAAQPRLLIADEATSALDTIVQAGIARLLEQLVETENLSLLFITHDLALARRMSRRVVILEGGRVVRDALFDEAERDPGGSYVERLFAARIGLNSARLA